MCYISNICFWCWLIFKNLVLFLTFVTFYISTPFSLTIDLLSFWATLPSHIYSVPFSSVWTFACKLIWHWTDMIVFCKDLRSISHWWWYFSYQKLLLRDAHGGANLGIVMITSMGMLRTKVCPSFFSRSFFATSSLSIGSSSLF